MEESSIEAALEDLESAPTRAAAERLERALQESPEDALARLTRLLAVIARERAEDRASHRLPGLARPLEDGLTHVSAAVGPDRLLAALRACLSDPAVERTARRLLDDVFDSPSTLDDAVERVIASLTEDQKAAVRATEEDDLGRFWTTIASSIRARFGLWTRRNQALLAACRASDADGASAKLLKAAWNRLNDRPLDWHLFALQRAFVCSRCGREGVAQAHEWSALDRAVLEPCEACRLEDAPQRRRAEGRDSNAAVKARADHARSAGQAIERALGASTGAVSDAELVALASELHARDEAFRRSWDAVHDAAPREGHASWLRLWVPADRR